MRWNAGSPFLNKIFLDFDHHPLFPEVSWRSSTHLEGFQALLVQQHHILHLQSCKLICDGKQYLSTRPEAELILLASVDETVHIR